MVPNTEKLMEAFISELPRSIEGNVTASKPQTLEEAINAQIHAKVDGKKVVISEASIRRDLWFGDKGDEAVNEKMYDSLERATTTATGLDAEQDKGNISKTQSKTKLKELMDLCTKLSDRVLNLEITKTAQAKEIANLKKRVKRLERKRKSRTHGLKRLYKVGLSARVESSSNDYSLSEDDSSKQGRISDIDVNQDIYLVNVHRDEDIFGVNDQNDTSMLDAGNDLQGEEVIVEEVNAASIATTTIAATTPIIFMDEITLVKALIEIKTSRPKAKGLVMKLQEDIYEQERLVGERARQEEETNSALIETREDIQAKKRRKFFAAKRDEERRKKPPTKAQQRSIMTTYLKNMDGWKPRAWKNKSFAKIKELFDKAMERINSFVDFKTELVEESTKKAQAETAQESSSKRAGDNLDQEKSKKQKVEDDKEQEELKKCWKSFQMIDMTADGNSQMYLTFSKTLKNFDKEVLKVLWRLVKDRFVKTKPMDDMDSFLMHTLKTMFEHHVEDTVWKS
nr:reverse transcriptase domain-containing protein [Tanacetum cinerariifolium]